MIEHFEDLWCQAENFHKNSDSSISSIMDELSMKINLYKLFESQKDSAELKKIKSRTLGEILLVITNLSLKEDINVFEALNTALSVKI